MYIFTGEADFQGLDYLPSLRSPVKIILRDLAKILLLVLINTKNQKNPKNRAKCTIMCYNLPQIHHFCEIHIFIAYAQKYEIQKNVNIHTKYAIMWYNLPKSPVFGNIHIFPRFVFKNTEFIKLRNHMKYARNHTKCGIICYESPVFSKVIFSLRDIGVCRALIFDLVSIFL